VPPQTINSDPDSLSSNVCRAGLETIMLFWSPFALSTVSITGATGFIGKHLAQYHLERGDCVRVLVRQPGTHPIGTTPFHGDLHSDIPVAFADGSDVIYHLAGEFENPARMYYVNAVGTANLLAKALGRCGRWVQLSSVGVYGPPLDDVEITESTIPRPTNVYERSKLAADRAVEAACDRAGCPWAILRPSNIVGAAMRNQSAFALVRAIVSGRFVFVGSPDAMSTYVHVEDVVRALAAMASAPSGTIANVSSDCPWSLLVSRICDRARCSPPRFRIPKWSAQAMRYTVGLMPGFPLTSSRINALSRRGGYPIGSALRLSGFHFARPMPEGFDEVTDRALLIK
jgi:nucleoside-diphosphate-sugar epimerase